MRIAFFHNLPSGGAKRVVYYQLKHLLQKHDVDLYTIKSHDSDFLNFSKLKCNVYKYSFSLSKKKGPVNKLLNDLKVFWGLRSLHKKIASDIDSKKYDIVIVHPDRYTQAPFILSFLKTKKAYYCHELLRLAYEKHLIKFKAKTPIHLIYERTNRTIRKNIDKNNALKADIILTNSKYTKRNVEKNYGAKAVVCYPGVDVGIFKKRHIKKEYDILFVGDRVKEDGYDLYEKVINCLPKKIKYLCVSTREEAKWISDIDLSKAYNSAKVVLSLAVNEPLGLVPLEAMSCATPIVAVSEGGYKETVIHGKTGYLISKSPREISLKVQMLLTNTKLMKEFSDNSANYIRNTWSWEKRIIDLEKVIKEQILLAS